MRLLFKHWLILAACAVSAVPLSAESSDRVAVRIEHALQVRAVVFSPDGAMLASGAADQKVCLWDAATGKKLQELSPNRGSIRAVAFSPDGKILAAATSERAIVMWDVATGQERNRWLAHRTWVTAIVFTPDGKSLVSRGEDGRVRLWDLAGKEVRSFEALPPGATCLELSPDGRLLAAGDHINTIHVWETATGKELFQLAGHRSPVVCLAFSPDSKTLASAAQENEVRLWEMALGQERCRLRGGEVMIFCLAFSLDGRMLFTGGMDKTVHLWDLASCQQLPSLSGHASTVAALSVAPDGRRLATGSHDGAVFVWDAPRHNPINTAAGLSAKELETRWNDLASEDAPCAYQATWGLASAPAQALPLLRTHLQPSPAPDPVVGKRIARLMSDLDSDEFVVREKATRELEKLGSHSVSSLSHLLTGKPSAEVRHRVEGLLGKLAPPKSRLQQLRAIEVLEHIGTREAKEMLELIRQGTPDAEVVEEARAALARLAKRGERS